MNYKDEDPIMNFLRETQEYEFRDSRKNEAYHIGAVFLNEKMDKAYYIRSDIKTLLNDNDGAVKDITTAINLNPKEPNYYERRGAILYFTDSDAFTQDMHKASQLRKQKNK